MPINKSDRLLTDDDLRTMFDVPMPERPTPAYMYDEGADQSTLLAVRMVGVYVTTVQEQHQTGMDSDFRVLAYARVLGCTLIVNDKSFKQYHQRLMRLNLHHAGILSIKQMMDAERLAAYVALMKWISDEKEVPNIMYNQYVRIR